MELLVLLLCFALGALACGLPYLRTVRRERDRIQAEISASIAEMHALQAEMRQLEIERRSLRMLLDAIRDGNA